jgi:hypothetical protein
MPTCGDYTCEVNEEVFSSAVSPQLSGMLQSAQCVFPQVALFLEFKEICRLDVVSRDIIPEAWENQVWHAAANNACTSSNSFQLSNLDKQTIREFMKHVVCTTPVIDSDTIDVESIASASKMIQFACEMSPSLSISHSARNFVTRFEFDFEALEEYAMDSSAIPFSYPVIFDLGIDKYILEISLQSDELKLSMHSFWQYSKAELCREFESDDEEAEPVAFHKPLRVRLCSFASSLVVRNEYVVTHVDVDAFGHGVCNMPSSPEILRQALVEGVACIVSVAEMTQDELDGKLHC